MSNFLPFGPERRYGGRKRKNPIGHILSKIAVDPTTGCWLWTGRKFRNGYARLTIARAAFGLPNFEMLVHRFTYEFYKDEIPEGLQLDHLCRVRHCVNPDHLEAVTGIENRRRGIGPAVTSERHKAQTHCKRGHEFSRGNTWISWKGIRHCRACSRERTRRYRLCKRMK